MNPTRTFKVTAITALATHVWYMRAESAAQAQMDAWDSFGHENVKIIATPIN